MTAEAPPRELRRGWTTGACATAAVKAAFGALAGLGFADPVAHPPAARRRGELRAGRAGARDGGRATAAVVKDAGDDPDVTHGCLVRATVRRGAAGSGVTFHAGRGVGTVTRPGLQIPPGEAAINPVPRQMMREVVAEIAAATGDAADVAITIAIPGGEELAQKTLNPRLGIVGGLSILGTTGVVVPFSCAAWIHSIHRGIDVARAAGLDHVAAATGSTSERTVQATLRPARDGAARHGRLRRRHAEVSAPPPGRRGSPSPAASPSSPSWRRGIWTCIRRAPRSTSSRSPGWRRSMARRHALADGMIGANTANQMLALAADAEFPLADLVAAGRGRWPKEVAGPDIALEVLVVDRQGRVVGRAPGW